jgi:hypothetical protein
MDEIRHHVLFCFKIIVLQYLASKGQINASKNENISSSNGLKMAKMARLLSTRRCGKINILPKTLGSSADLL